MSLSEYESEPVRGLPGQLPSGERLLWQGSPRTWSLASGALRVPLVAGYFAVIALWQAGSAWLAGQRPATVVHALTVPLLLGVAACGVLGLIAWASARATVYSITNRRLVIRQGIALPMSLNLPFSKIDAAAVKLRRDGTGDLAIRLARGQRVGYLLNWPHVRPGHYLQPQPTLRGIPEPQRVAQVLAAALSGGTVRTTASPAPSRRESAAAATAAA